ncbi:MAG: shikimate dehydrogenase [Opitutales bacterium]|nr:shikimate dehydrogenase [Opitutales bacterium]
MSEEPNYKVDLVGVFGHPVSENPTVLMIESAFRELGLNWRYVNFEVLPQDLEAAVAGLRAMNFKGINLTIPHKVEVLQYLDEIAPDAKLMGAVNTVRREGDRLIGENTDGKGFLRSIQEDAGIDPAGKRIVFLGAGGAARAMTVEMALAGAENIIIVNRSAERGESLVQLLNDQAPAEAQFVPWDQTFSIPEGTDVLVNSTSIGLYPNVDDRPDVDYDSITSSMVACDVIPNPPNTPFLQEAEKRGAKTLDGLGMLVGQGAIGLKMWTGHDAPVSVMRKALEEVFG